jgi:hypothetical protein
MVTGPPQWPVEWYARPPEQPSSCTAPEIRGREYSVMMTENVRQTATGGGLIRSYGWNVQLWVERDTWQCEVVDPRASGRWWGIEAYPKEQNIPRGRCQHALGMGDAVVRYPERDRPVCSFRLLPMVTQRPRRGYGFPQAMLARRLQPFWLR